MNLPALYNLLASRCNSDSTIRLPIWSDIAAAAEVGPLEDSAALRALIEKGAVTRRTVRNTFGDCEYVLRYPQPGYHAAFDASLKTIGATVHHIVMPL